MNDILQVTTVMGKSLDIPYQNVFLLNAFGGFSKLYYKNTLGHYEIVTIQHSLKELEVLSKNHFFRIHKSFLINIEHVVPYESYPNDTININFGYLNISVPISRLKKLDFHNIYKRRIKSY